MEKPDKYELKGEEFYNQEKYLESIFYMEKALNANSKNHINCYTKIALSKSCLGDFEGALNAYSELLKYEPNDPRHYALRCDTKRRLGMYHEGLNDCNRAILLAPDSDAGFGFRGIIKFYLEDYYGAINDLNIAIEINNKYATTYLYRGHAKIKLKEDTGALQDLNTAIKIDNNYAEAYYIRGIMKILIFNERQSGCLDLSKAGELGRKEAYKSIKELCNS